MGLKVRDYHCRLKGTNEYTDIEISVLIEAKTFDSAVLKAMIMYDKEIGFEVDDPITIEVEDAFSEEKKVFVMEKRLRVEYVYREES